MPRLTGSQIHVDQGLVTMTQTQKQTLLLHIASRIVRHPEHQVTLVCGRMRHKRAKGQRSMESQRETLKIKSSNLENKMPHAGCNEIGRIRWPRRENP